MSNTERFNKAAWMRVVNDLPPASCMQTARAVKIAAQAQWQQREPIEEKLLDYARQWHKAGWQPQDWWALATSLTLARAIEPASVKHGRRIEHQHEQHPREFSLDIAPDQWSEWPELAAQHGALRATLALLMHPAISHTSALFWAKKPVRISEMTYLPGVTFVSTVDGAPMRTPGPEHWQIIPIDPFENLDINTGNGDGMS